MIENCYQRLRASVLLWYSKPSPQNLGYEQFGIERSFFVGDDLKDVLDIPSFRQHAHRRHPLNRVVFLIDLTQQRNVALMLEGRGNNENLLRRQLFWCVLLSGEEINQLLR